MTTDAQLLERIAQVDPVHAEMMTRQPTVFTPQELNFYKKYRLVRAEVRLLQRPMLLWYADDGAQAVSLGTGKPQAIYELNQKEGLALSAPQVPDYLKFFVAHTDGGKRKVVERAEDIRWRKATGTDPTLGDKKASAVARLKPVSVTPTDQGFEVVAVVQVGSRLAECTYGVRKDGRVVVLEQQEMMEGLPVPTVL